MKAKQPAKSTVDLTPLVGAQTDVAALGRTASKPPHEQTADEDIDVADWEKLAADPGFRNLLAMKKLFVIPATLFFIVYYFALPVLVGYAPKLMSKPVIGPVNFAYLFALSQFFMAWILAGLYIIVANRLDRMSENLIRNFRSRGK